MAARGQEGRKRPYQNAGAASANISLVIVMMVMVVVMMMIVVVMMVVMIIVMMVVVVVMVVLSNDHRLLFDDAGAFVLGSQNVLCIRNGIQQLGKRPGGLEHVGFVYRRRGARLRAAKESERRGAAQESHDGLIHDVSFPA
jgi:hypothetical protein